MDMFMWHTSRSSYGLSASPGQLSFLIEEMTDPYSSYFSGPTTSYKRLEIAGLSRKMSGTLGFDWNQDTIGEELSTRSLSIPFWFIASISGIPAFLLLRRKRSAIVGKCAACGYDLRATPERCPECGAISKTHSGFSTTAS